MKSDSTPDYSNIIQETKPTSGKKGKRLTPSKQTVMLLKQFARAYQVEKRMPNTLQGMVLN